jgi:hypothetical protein
METQRKGVLTEAVAVAALQRRSIPVSIPFGDTERYDLVAESQRGLHRLQVKTGNFDGEVVAFKGFSVHTNSTGNVHETYDGDVDQFLVYCHELDAMYLVPEGTVESNMRLRVAEPAQRQPSINWASEYELDERWPPAEGDR